MVLRIPKVDPNQLSLLIELYVHQYLPVRQAAMREYIPFDVAAGFIRQLNTNPLAYLMNSNKLHAILINDYLFLHPDGFFMRVKSYNKRQLTASKRFLLGILRQSGKLPNTSMSPAEAAAAKSVE